MKLAREIKSDVKQDLKVAKKMHLRWRGLLCVFVGALVIGLVFDHFGRFDLARPAFFSAGAIAFALAIKWNQRRSVWLWITFLFLVALHVALIASVSWTDKWVPAAVSAGICTMDVFMMLTIIDAVEIFVKRRETQSQRFTKTQA